jgi:hypothetical protein
MMMKQDYYGFLDYSLRIVPRNVLKMYDDTKVSNDIPEIIPFFRLWARNATILWIIHISLGIIATILAILITAFSASGESYRGYVPVLSVITAIAAALLTSLDIGTKSNNTRNAWRLLNFAMMKYNRGIISIPDVIDAYQQGENLISGVNITLPPTLQQHPIAIIKPDFPTAKTGQKISLDASQSVGDNIVSYAWRKLNGSFMIENDNSRTAAVLIPSDLSPGSSVTISLTVTDSYGRSAEAQKTISITEPPPSPSAD